MFAWLTVTMLVIVAASVLSVMTAAIAAWLWGSED